MGDGWLHSLIDDLHICPTQVINCLLESRATSSLVLGCPFFRQPENQLDGFPDTRSNSTDFRTRQARSWQETEAVPVTMQPSNPEVVRRKELTWEEEDQEPDHLVDLKHQK